MKQKLLSCLLAALLLVVFLAPVSALAALPPAPGSVYEGVDVSKWQGEIDFEKVAAAGIRVVYIRAGADADYEDPYFEKNYAGAKAAGLKIGFYLSMTAKTEAEAQAQADFFLGLIGGKTYDCRLAMDYGAVSGLSKAQANANALAFLNRLLEKTGDQPVIYTDASGARDLWNSAVAAAAQLWVAQYGVTEPESVANWAYWAGWQYTNKGRVDGVSGNVDRDRFTDEMFLDAPKTAPGQKVPPVAKSKLIQVTVVRGDTLSKIAARYQTTVSELVTLNKIANPNLILVGQVLYVRVSPDRPEPANDVYIVQKGDTLSKIARRFGTTVSRLAAINLIRNPDLIFIGQRLDLGAA